MRKSSWCENRSHMSDARQRAEWHEKEAPCCDFCFDKPLRITHSGEQPFCTNASRFTNFLPGDMDAFAPANLHSNANEETTIIEFHHDNRDHRNNGGSWLINNALLPL